MNLNKEEKILIAEALLMRACFIETGNPVISAVDIKNSHGALGKCCDLSEHQRHFVKKVRSLATKLLS